MSSDIVSIALAFNTKGCAIQIQSIKLFAKLLKASLIRTVPSFHKD